MNKTTFSTPSPGKPPARPKMDMGSLLERIKRQRRIIEERQKSVDQKEKKAAWYYSLAKEEKRIYDAKEKQLEEEVKRLQEELKQEVRQLKKTAKTISQQVEKAASQPIPNPGRYHLHFLARLKEFLSGLVKNINQANEWLAHWNQYCKKKGSFWNTFVAKKKGGSKFLLSSEHYLTRSAG